MMKAQQLRTVILASNDLTVLHGLLDTLSAGGALTAAETGVDDEDPISDLSLVGEPRVIFDGFKYTLFLFVTTA